MIGYYTLSGYSAHGRRAPNRLGRNQSDPLPGVLIGRLTVDERFEGIGLGKALLRDEPLSLYMRMDDVRATIMAP